MFNKTSPGMIQTTVLISPQFNDLRKEHHITLSEAVRVGISMILAERGVADYDNSLNLVRLLQESKRKAVEWAEKASKLEQEMEEKDAKDTKK